MPQTKFEAQEESCMDSNNKSGQKMLFVSCAEVDQFLVKDSITELEIKIYSFPDGDFCHYTQKLSAPGSITK